MIGKALSLNLTAMASLRMWFDVAVQILSMIEEAAGTRMYESKRSSAQKTIEKKDNKLKEIEAVC